MDNPQVAQPAQTAVALGLLAHMLSIVYILYLDFLANVSGHRRRLVRRTVERLVQQLHSAWLRRLSPENLCLGVEMACFSVFGAILGCLGRFSCAKPALFLIFFL